MTETPHWYPGITDEEAQVDVPDGAEDRPWYAQVLAHGWVDGVGRYAWGSDPEDARARWARHWRGR